MTIEEKRAALSNYCKGYPYCDKCKCVPDEDEGVCFSGSDEVMLKNYERVFGSEPDPNVNPAEDPVNHPSHYNKGKIEVWDFISDWKLNFDRGNAIKYICRAGSKDPNKEIQDLEKAIEYINHEIKILKGETENGTEKEN